MTDKRKNPELMIRNSEVASFKQCRLQWYWSYVKRRRTMGYSGALACGTLWHQVMELWYPPGPNRGAKHPRELILTANRMCVEAGEYPEDAMHKAVTGSGGEEIPIVDLCAAMADSYFNAYGVDEHLDVIAPEMTFQVQTPVGVAVGQIDLTVFDKDLQEYGIYEHKTGAGLEPFGAPEHLDEQSGMYWTYGPIFLMHSGAIEFDYQITFLRFNRVAKVVDNDTRPENSKGQKLNQDGSVSKKQPGPKVKRSVVYRTVDQRRALDKRFQQVAREMEFVRKKRLPVYKVPGRHCGWCDYAAACEVHELDGDFNDVLRLTTTKWDPYEAHQEKDQAPW